MSLRVMVATDGSAASLRTADCSIHMSRLLATRLTLVHILPGSRLVRSRWPTEDPDTILRRQRRQGWAMLQRVQEHYRQGGLAADAIIRAGALEESLCSAARDGHSDLLVLGHRSKGHFSARIFGSVALRVMQDTQVPLLLVRSDGPGRPAAPDKVAELRLLLALDGSDGSARCIAFLEKLQSYLRVPAYVQLLHVLNRHHPRISHLPRNTRYAVLEREQARAGTLLQEASSSLRAAGYGVEIRSEEGSAGGEICRIAGEGAFDLVMMGRHRHGETRNLLHGAVSRHVATYSPVHFCLVP